MHGFGASSQVLRALGYLYACYTSALRVVVGACIAPKDLPGSPGYRGLRPHGLVAAGALMKALYFVIHKSLCCCVSGISCRFSRMRRMRGYVRGLAARASWPSYQEYYGLLVCAPSHMRIPSQFQRDSRKNLCRLRLCFGQTRLLLKTCLGLLGTLDYGTLV